MLQHLIPCVQLFQTPSGKSLECILYYGPIIEVDIFSTTLVYKLPKPVKKTAEEPLDLEADLWNEVMRRVGDHSAKIKLTLDVQK